jgi:hypothetical protein
VIASAVEAQHKRQVTPEESGFSCAPVSGAAHHKYQATQAVTKGSQSPLHVFPKQPEIATETFAQEKATHKVQKATSPINNALAADRTEDEIDFPDLDQLLQSEEDSPQMITEHGQYTQEQHSSVYEDDSTALQGSLKDDARDDIVGDDLLDLSTLVHDLGLELQESEHPVKSRDHDSRLKDK